jgi:hypothetical protein
MARYDDLTGITRYDIGLHYDETLPASPPGLERKKRMDKLKTSYSQLNPAETLALLNSHDTAMTGNANYTAPVPDAAAMTAMIALVGGAIANLATAEAARDTAITAQTTAVAQGQGLLTQRANSCNAVTPGDRAKLQTSGLPLVDARTPAGPTPRVQNLTLSDGDVVGNVDVAFDSLRKAASSYQIQSTLALGSDPNTATWTNHDPVTKSSATIGPFTSGTRIWARARAIGTNGPGDWSDPATIIVP